MGRGETTKRKRRSCQSESSGNAGLAAVASKSACVLRRVKFLPFDFHGRSLNEDSPRVLQGGTLPRMAELVILKGPVFRAFRPYAAA